jgi:cyclopropane fatty-acyl-phospholipid synthase-like methyltransferase
MINGWGEEEDNNSFIENRNPGIGVKTVATWLKSLKSGATVLDIGCGFGIPNTELLLNAGCNVYGIDASPTLINELRRRFPKVRVACEAVETSRFFNLKFDGIIAIGLMFLLPERDQLQVLQKISKALNNKGQFLFTAPFRACSWNDSLTGNKSISLGKEVYVNELLRQGLILMGEYTDEGENHYFDFIKNGKKYLDHLSREPIVTPGVS